MSGYAWGKCPLGCGAVGGDVEPEGSDLEGFVRLWRHASVNWSTEHGGQVMVCSGSRQRLVPLPLAAPLEIERQETIAGLDGEVDMATWSPDELPAQ